MRIFLLLTLLTLSFSVSAKKITLPFMGRQFTLITPDKNTQQKKPLLVLLHGCKQSSEVILEGTQLAAEVQKNDFILLSPEQSVFSNYDHCWNWFMAFNQVRGKTNEMGQIIAAIEMLTVSHKVDRSKVYLAGISAGGVMAHNLSACYPDYFAGVAIHSGLAYKIAEDLYEAQTVLTASKLKSPSYLGKKASECSRTAGPRLLRKMILIHGEEDVRVDPYHTELISKTNEVMMDYLDDGKKNNSAESRTTSNTVNFPKGYTATRTDKIYSGMAFSERSYLIKNLAHAWGGGKAISANFDPEAPSSNDLILKYLQLKK